MNYKCLAIIVSCIHKRNVIDNSGHCILIHLQICSIVSQNMYFMLKRVLAHNII